MKTRPIFLVVLMSITCFIGFAQIEENNRSNLSIEKIMQDPVKWIGSLPEDIHWDETGKYIFFNWNPEGNTLTSLYKYSFSSGKTEKVPPSEKKILPERNGSYNHNKSLKVFIRNGNLFLLDIRKGTEKQLSTWPENISSAKFALNDTHVSFMKDQNLFLLNLSTGTATQVIQFVQEEKKTESKPDEQAQWLSRQQLELFDVLKERKAAEKAREKRDEEMKPVQPEKIYLGKNRLANAILSPLGNYVAYMVYQNPTGAKSTSVTHWITESGYTEEKNARPKTGSPETKSHIGLFDLKSNTSVKIETSSLPGLKELPGFLSEYPLGNPVDSAKVNNREINLVGPVWHPEKDLILLTALSIDNKDRWILLYTPADRALKVLDHQHDEAWIGGPGVGGGSLNPGTTGWMPDGKAAWFHSEESGYSHLYSVNIETGKKKALTSGTFEVYDAFLSASSNHFYFTANAEHPGERHFYRMPAEGGQLVRLTSGEGNHETVLSPDEKFLAIRYSAANKPWELIIQENKPGASKKQITTSVREEFNSYPWRMPEFISYKAQDGAEVHARLYRPETAVKKGPAVIFVHGAGYLQNAHKWWSSYYREYMFHNYLVDNGYTVLDIDYRGSAGYGRDWRTGIYRHMGGKDLSDHIDGAFVLVEKYGIDPQKIGIYGGSYGGFITLMAMFTKPGVFAAGAALRSVTDWAHYNHGYTSNILNTPSEDSLAYVRSSPIYYAEGLEGALLMCHGMVDDNVQFQDIVRLSQRLIELGKENWELAVYPVEPHAFSEPSSWTDEYKRIFKLFEDNLKRQDSP
jgi:dipeptidyl aminopeptidase/acylaminoacyl peptidase